MKKLSMDVEVFSSISIFISISIRLISEDRIPDGGKVDANLMGTSCLDTTLHESIFILDFRFQGSIVSDGTLTSRINTYFRFIFCIFDSEESCVDRISRLKGRPDNHSMIYFLNPTSLEF